MLPGLREVGAVMKGMCPAQPQPVQIREDSRTTLDRAQDLAQGHGAGFAVLSRHGSHPGPARFCEQDNYF